MKRIAAPMTGGLFTSFVLELAVYPAVYEICRSRGSRAFRPKERPELISATGPAILTAAGQKTPIG